uniref:Uncharacterized protein n=1 Tax=Halalkalibacterium halodurans TaxID=86665 RepID=A0A0M0KM49_ALKHA
MRSILVPVIIFWVIASLSKIYGKDPEKGSWFWIFFGGISIGFTIFIFRWLFDINIGPNYE